MLYVAWYTRCVIGIGTSANSLSAVPGIGGKWSKGRPGWNTMESYGKV